MKNQPAPAKSRALTDLLENVAANLYRHRETGVYWGVKKTTGKRSFHVLETTVRKVADGRLRDWLGELGKIDRSQSDMTLEMLLRDYEKARSGIKHSTKVGEAGRMKMFRTHFPRPMESPVARVTPTDISEWLGIVNFDRDEHGGRTLPKRASTRNQNRAFVRALFDFAALLKVRPDSPFNAKLHPKAKKDKITRHIPTEEEFSRIIAEIRRPTWKPNVDSKGRRLHGGQRPMTNEDGADFAEWLGLAGIGQAEAVGLQWHDIDESGDIIRYYRKKTSVKFHTPVFEWLKPLLARLREKGGGAAASGPVFKVKNVKKALAGALARLGLPHFTQRGLRMTRIRSFWEAGIDPKTVAGWQGHQDGGRLIIAIYTETFGSKSATYEKQQAEKAARAFAAAKAVDGKIVSIAA